MKLDGVVCDTCLTQIANARVLDWDQKPSVFTLDFPRDGVNGGHWNMDVCAECRGKLYDAITHAVDCLRTGKPSRLHPELDVSRLRDDVAFLEKRIEGMNAVFGEVRMAVGANGQHDEEPDYQSPWLPVGLMSKIDDVMMREQRA